MALGSTQPLTKLSTRYLPGGKGQPAGKGVGLFCRRCNFIRWVYATNSQAGDSTRTTSLRYIASARTAQETFLPSMRVLSLPGKQRV
jgi:hypothetical protein